MITKEKRKPGGGGRGALSTMVLLTVENSDNSNGLSRHREPLFSGLWVNQKWAEHRLLPANLIGCSQSGVLSWKSDVDPQSCPLKGEWEEFQNQIWKQFAHFPAWDAGLSPCRTPQSASWSLVMFLWCMLWWRTNSSERANFFWQLCHRQLKGFSLVLPVWVLVWVFRWSDRENFRWQVLHWNGFTPVCLLWCLLSWSERENLLSQSLKSHWYGFSPVCFRLCICKWDSLKYLLLQPGYAHMKGRFSLVSDADRTRVGATPDTRRTSWMPRKTPWVCILYWAPQRMGAVWFSLSYPVPWPFKVAPRFIWFQVMHSSWEVIWYKLSLL